MLLAASIPIWSFEIKMERTRRLKRGLKDISPLFASPKKPSAPKIIPPEQPSATPSQTQILSISSHEFQEDSLFLNSYFASQIASKAQPCDLISLTSQKAASRTGSLRSKESESFGPYVKRHWLHWDQFEQVTRADWKSQKISPLKGGNLFIDFECQNSTSFERVVKLLDKWILFLKPEIHSLTEGYKLMKAALTINRDLEFFILLEGKAEGSRTGFLFERFASVVSKHLRVSLGCFGWLYLPKEGHSLASDFHADQLLLSSPRAMQSPEKIALASWVENLSTQTPTQPMATV